VPAKFVLLKGTAGTFRFTLLAPNGQVVASSEAYGSKVAALAGIASVRGNAAGADLDDRTTGAASVQPAARRSAPARATPTARAAKPAAKKAARPAAKKAARMR
jgi:uncharacterized protein